MLKYDLELAHKYSSNHKQELKKDKLCGCFYCLAIFSPNEIKEWIVENTLAIKSETAICPYCGLDAVIGESSSFPITKSFLEMMHKKYF